MAKKQVKQVQKVQKVQNKEVEKEVKEIKEEKKAYKASEIVEACYKKHADAVKDAKQFAYCALPSIPYASKRAISEGIDNLKRINGYHADMDNFELSIEMLEKAIAYLYHRKING